MRFKQYLREDLTKQLDETYRGETWAEESPGRLYYDVHLSVIDQREMAAPVFKEFLGSGGMKVLESGCGTGRWIAYFEKLGNCAFGIDDSPGPLQVARRHDPYMRLARADAVMTPFKDGVFDAALSAYVAEHFPDGPDALFREIHRTLKPNGLLFSIVPLNNTFRRLIVNPLLLGCNLLWQLRGHTLGFTEFRFSREEVDELLERSGFEVIRTLPDDFVTPWFRGLSVDLCDLLCFFGSSPERPLGYRPKRLFEFGRFGTVAARAIRSLGLWHSCAGVLHIARAKK